MLTQTVVLFYMKHIYLFWVFILSILLSYAQQTKKVYFIGNSYTITNNLPNLIKQVAASTGNILDYDETTPGGESWQNHMYNPTVTNTIQNTAWDYVVLQEQSQRPALHDSYSFPYAAVLNDRIKKSNPCVQTMFFMTWGYKEGDKVNCNGGLTYMCTYEGMDDKIYDSYMRLAKENKALVSPVGKVWRTIRDKHPALELYSLDKSHPSMLGSMAAAYTFYTLIFQQDPTLVTYNSSISPSDAAILKQIVKEVVYDDLSAWTFTVRDKKAQFSFNLTEDATFTFTNESSLADTYHWDFGDGTTSDLENPTHSYTEIGTYTITLTVEVCGERYMTQQEIVVETLSLEQFNSLEFKIYPNPTMDYLRVDTQENLLFSIFDLAGKKQKVVVDLIGEHVQIEVNHLARGTYILVVEDKNQKVTRFKFVRK